MKLLKLKEFTQAEKDQLHHLNFVGAGNLSKASNKTKWRLVDKRVRITEYNFWVRLKNFCIILSNGFFDEEEYIYISNAMDMYKTKEIHHWDLSIYNETTRKNLLQSFIQYTLSKRYLMMYAKNRNLIK